MSVREGCRVFLLVTGAWLWLAAPAIAQQAPATASQALPPPRFYIGLSGGVVVPADRSVAISGASNGVAVSGSGTVNFQDVGLFSLFAGYHLNRYLAGEVEISHASMTLRKFSGTLSATGIGTSTATTALGGDVDNNLLMANLIVTPLGKTRLSPYVGGGAGIDLASSSLNTIYANGGSATVNATTSSATPAAAAIVGIDFAVSRSIVLGLRYSYLWIDRVSVGGGLSGAQTDLTAQIISLRGAYRF